MIDKQLSYLLGLIVGRGHFYIDSKIIAIEFSHHNEYTYGISHCPKCGFLATKDGELLRCKNKACNEIVDSSLRNVYNQPESTIESIKEDIIPFLKQGIPTKFNVTGNRSMTLLVLDFSNSQPYFDKIISFFPGQTSYDTFHIPPEISQIDKSLKIEFVNGLLDTSGFPSPGGWLNRDGKNGHGRMRVYFQIVRNWYLPVEIDNFLRLEFDLPIHTIDWGHPNIRDANMEDYYNSNPTSWSREHQIKFFPEYYESFGFRIKCKDQLFRELLEHNKKVDFEDKDDWFPPSPIKKGKIKPYHPGEQDLRIPEQARRHFDAFWQINLAMGCKYLSKIVEDAKYPKCFSVTGQDKKCSIKKLEKDLDKIRQEKSNKIHKNYRLKSKDKNKVLRKSIRQDQKEIEFYEPIGNYLKYYLKKNYLDDIEIFDTSKYNLDLFLKNSNKELLEIFDYCSKYRIKPDIVGFMINYKKIAFVEVKITQLDMKCLGQLLGYCLVAKPEIAILVSTEKVSSSLIKSIKANPHLLEYSQNKKIKLGQWYNNEITFEDL